MDNVTKKVSKYFFYLISVCYATEGIVEVLVGSIWPTIAKSIGADISLIGILVMVNYLGSFTMSINTYKIRQKIGTNLTMVLSMCCFIISLVIYKFAPDIVLFAIGMFINGMGISLIEVNASSYVLKAYNAKEEAFLNAFWALGSVIGSTIMALAVRYCPQYQTGFFIIIMIMIIDIILLLFAKASWIKQKKSLPKEVVDKHSVTDEEKTVNIKMTDLVKEKNILSILLCFFLVEGVIITTNSLISTISVKQGLLSEAMAATTTIIYFMAIFFGRLFYSHIANKIKITRALKTNIFIIAILFVLFYTNLFNGIIICILIVILGLVAAPLIPLLYSYLKEKVRVTHLSALLGYGDVSGLCGIIIMSGLTTIIMKLFSINDVELLFAILIFILYALFIRLDAKEYL